jgi:hypothetical protein
MMFNHSARNKILSLIFTLALVAGSVAAAPQAAFAAEIPVETPLLTVNPAGINFAAIEPEEDHSPVAPAQWVNPFTDVTGSDWFYEDVEYAVVNGLFSGLSATAFGPDTPMTRSMLVTVLFRLEAPARGPSTTDFTDVPLYEYYSDAVAWATANGIVAGAGDNKFVPDAAITRQDLAAILLRYAEFIGKGPRGAWAIRLDYTDLDQVADYAAPAVMWTTMKGVTAGKSDHIFDPQGSATRAEVAAMLHRFTEAVA